MKTTILLLLAAFAGANLIHAAKIAGGPKGGQLLDAEPLKAEFFVDDDRKVEITFYDAALKPVAPTGQVVAVTAELPAGRAPVELERTAAGFVSKAPLPPGEPYRVVVQVRATAEAKPKNFRIDLSLAACGECQRKEYACTCEGH